MTPNVAWHQDILDVIYRTSNLAVRHVKLRLEKDGDRIQDVVTTWKEPRYPPYKDYMAKVTLDTIQNPHLLDAGDKTCLVCLTDFDSGEHAALVLRCDRRHLICRHDFIKWCQEKGPANASCPQCRKVFFDKSDATDLKYGTRGNSYFADRHGNETFNDYETFERSCADLDKNLTENNEAVIEVNARFARHVLDLILKGALLEGADSTPLHLQPARSLECALLMEALPRLLEPYDKTVLPMDIFHDRLQGDILQLFLGEYLEAGMHRYLSDAQWQDMRENPTPKKLWLRPGC